MFVDQHEPDREALKELVAQAQIFAKEAMLKVGQVPPILFMETMEGRTMFSPGAVPDERSKDYFATTARLMSIARGATATVFVADALTRTFRTDSTPRGALGETRPATEPLGQHALTSAPTLLTSW